MIGTEMTLIMKFNIAVILLSEYVKMLVLNLVFNV